MHTYLSELYNMRTTNNIKPFTAYILQIVVCHKRTLKHAQINRRASGV